MLVRSPRLFPALVALALPLAPVAAFAAAASISQDVNMRSGPAASYGVVGQLARGDSVDVRQCEGTFCEVLVHGKSGWVSASYLTRDAVPQQPGSPSADVPKTASTAPPPAPGPTPVPKIVAPGEPQIGTAVPPKSTAAEAPASVAPAAPKIASVPTPKVSTAPVLPVAPAHKAAPSPEAKTAALPPVKRAARPSLPPAYEDAEAGTAASGPGAVLPEVKPMPGPRPKVDIPNGRVGRDYAENGALPPRRDFADEGDDAWGPPPEVIGRVPYGWHRHFRRDFAGFAPGGRHVCFVDPAAGSGFCVREGDEIVAPQRWASHALVLRNPQGLNVTVCAADDDDCHTYVSSSPLVLGGRSIASITVAAPGY